MQIIYKTAMNLIFGACIILLFFIVTDPDSVFPAISLSFLKDVFSANFKTVFISILLEAFPFILLGVLVSAILQVFVSEETIQRWIPKNPFLAILFACGLGIVFPICECGMIPVIRKLLHKGMPLYVAVVFILTGPIINPVVYAATYMAFRSKPEIVYSRMGLAFIVASIIGLIVYRFIRSNPLRTLHNHHHNHEHNHRHDHKQGNKLVSVLTHSADEFFEMGKYLIFGSIITAVIQTGLSRESLVSIGHHEWLSQLFMMGFAYILSLCSTSDAFVASSFIATFSSGSILTFLVFGPMLDFKGTLMLLSVFKTRFVALLMILVALTVLGGSMLIERLILT